MVRKKMVNRKKEKRKTEKRMEQRDTSTRHSNRRYAVKGGMLKHLISLTPPSPVSMLSVDHFDLAD